MQLISDVPAPLRHSMPNDWQAHGSYVCRLDSVSHGPGSQPSSASHPSFLATWTEDLKMMADQYRRDLPVIQSISFIHGYPGFIRGETYHVEFPAREMNSFWNDNNSSSSAASSSTTLRESTSLPSSQNTLVLVYLLSRESCVCDPKEAHNSLVHNC